MRLWYKFLLILLVVGITLALVGHYYYFQFGEHQFGWSLIIYGAIILGFLLFVAFIYIQRFVKKL